MTSRTILSILAGLVLGAGGILLAEGILGHGLLGHDHPGVDLHEGEGAHHGHEHGDEESPLEMTVEEVFAASCEHGILTHECDECRYEVGMVRLDPSLLDGGLVTTATVTSGSVSATLDLKGELELDTGKVAHINPPVTGVVTKVFVQVEQKVEADTPLFEVESLDVAKAVSAYKGAIATHKLTKKTYYRLKDLAKKKLIADKSLLEAKQAYEVAAIDLDAAEATLQYLTIDLEALGTKTEGPSAGRLVIKAPFPGVVLHRHVTVGELVGPGADVVTIADPSTLWAWVRLYEADIPLVSGALEVAPLATGITVAAYPGETFPGTLDLVGAAMDPVSRTVKARVVVPAEGKLKPGMFATASLVVPGAAQGILVPEGALSHDEGKDFVFVHVTDSYYLQRPVIVGPSQGGAVVVTDGLEPGQTVVTEGAFLLKSEVLKEKMGAGCAD